MTVFSLVGWCCGTDAGLFGLHEKDGSYFYGSWFLAGYFLLSVLPEVVWNSVFLGFDVSGSHLFGVCFT